MQQTEIIALADHDGLGEREYASKGDVDEADDVHVCRLNNVPAIAIKIRWTGRASVHQRRAGSRQSVGIGLNTNGRMSGVDMGVQVDQARGHDLAAAITRIAAFQPIADSRDLAVSERNVCHAVNILGRVNNATALQHQVMHRTSFLFVRDVKGQTSQPAISPTG